MSKTKQLCSGCRNDYYNQSRPDGCWSFDKAQVVQKTRVGTWQPPPYQWQPVACLTCYHAQGFSMLDKDDSRFETAKATA